MPTKPSHRGSGVLKANQASDTTAGKIAARQTIPVKTGKGWIEEDVFRGYPDYFVNYVCDSSLLVKESFV